MEFRKSSYSGISACVEVGMGFVKATASNPNGSCVEVGADFVTAAACHTGGCVEVGADFVKSSASHVEYCVEVGADAKADSGCGPQEIVVRVRDSKQKDAKGNHNGPVLEFTEAEWDAFLMGMDAGPNCEFRIVRPSEGKPETGKSVGVACP